MSPKFRASAFYWDLKFHWCIIYPANTLKVACCKCCSRTCKFSGLRKPVLLYIAHTLMVVAHAYRSMRVPQSIYRLCYRVRLCDWRIKICHYQGRESVSDSVKFIPAIDGTMCIAYTDDLLPHVSLKLCSYWDMVKCFIYVPIPWSNSKF
jgi:hypothetical protein